MSAKEEDSSPLSEAVQGTDFDNIASSSARQDNSRGSKIKSEEDTQRTSLRMRRSSEKRGRRRKSRNGSLEEQIEVMHKMIDEDRLGMYAGDVCVWLLPGLLVGLVPGILVFMTFTDTSITMGVLLNFFAAFALALGIAVVWTRNNWIFLVYSILGITCCILLIFTASSVFGTLAMSLYGFIDSTIISLAETFQSLHDKMLSAVSASAAIGHWSSLEESGKDGTSGSVGKQNRSLIELVSLLRDKKKGMSLQERTYWSRPPPPGYDVKTSFVAEQEEDPYSTTNEFWVKRVDSVFHDSPQVWGGPEEYKDWRHRERENLPPYPNNVAEYMMELSMSYANIGALQGFTRRTQKLFGNEFSFVKWPRSYEDCHVTSLKYLTLQIATLKTKMILLLRWRNAVLKSGMSKDEFYQCVYYLDTTSRVLLYKNSYVTWISILLVCVLSGFCASACYCVPSIAACRAYWRTVGVGRERKRREKKRREEEGKEKQKREARKEEETDDNAWAQRSVSSASAIMKSEGP